jgi:hypothetical protein
MTIDSDLVNLDDNFESTVSGLKKSVDFWERYFLTLPGRINVIKGLSREPQKKKTQVRLDYSPAPTQLALLSPICFTDLKGRELATRRNPR